MPFLMNSKLCQKCPVCGTLRRLDEITCTRCKEIEQNAKEVAKMSRLTEIGSVVFAALCAIIFISMIVIIIDYLGGI